MGLKKRFKKWVSTWYFMYLSTPLILRVIWKREWYVFRQSPDFLVDIWVEMNPPNDTCQELRRQAIEERRTRNGRAIHNLG